MSTENKRKRNRFRERPAQNADTRETDTRTNTLNGAIPRSASRAMRPTTLLWAVPLRGVLCCPSNPVSRVGRASGYGSQVVTRSLYTGLS